MRSMKEIGLRGAARFVGFIFIAFVAGLAAQHVLQEVLASEADSRAPEGWLLSAPNDMERFRRLQQQLGGFDQTMWEVGQRFERMHEALQRRNFQLAEYHWEKIGKTIRNGIVRRPNRAANAEAMLLGANFKSIGAEFAKHDYDAAAAAFERARDVCVACHHAEKVAWVNDQRLLELSLTPASASAK
jgi:secreted Zn-dependent insulinase-like peptidase